MIASTNDPLTVSAPELDPAALHGALSTSWGLEGELIAVHGERDRNFRIEAPSGRYLLKVHNPADGEEVLDLQCSALRHIRTVAPDVPVPDVVPTRQGHRWVELTGRDGRLSLAWVMTWLEGRHPAPEELRPAQLREWGRTSARLGQALRGFVHAAASYPIAWDIRRLPQLRPWLSAVEEARRPAVRAVLDRFEQRVTPELHTVRAQVVHNDLAPTNVLVDDTLAVTGITDFGDMTHTALVCDLAVAAADVLSGRDGGLELAHEVVSGYDSTTPLEPQEVGLVADLMAGRYAAAILITAWRTREQGSAPEIDDAAYDQLEAMLDIGLDTLTARFTAAVAGGSRIRPYVGRGLPYRQRLTTELLRARLHSLGGLELSYTQPVHLVGGRGLFLQGADGRRYLDAYNNVPVLGHSHPAVVDAVCSQLATLNTNSRYLQEATVELAERLLATLPARLDRVLLVNSGSEANDLAWRLATTVTGGTGGLVTEFAYHGVTTVVADLSPEEWVHATAPTNVVTVPAPDGYRGSYRREEPDWTTRYAEHVDVAVATLAERGVAPAALFVDSGFTSDGILTPPGDYLQDAVRRWRAAGGLFVADEVQSGFGRPGSHLWGFDVHGVIPDVVTLGKPMGNGHPVAAVITRKDIVDRFALETEWFSTFGGNPVACEAALAVLDVIEQELVAQNALEQGAWIRARLEALMERHALIGEVRSLGLLIGVELIRDRNTREPAIAEAGLVLNAMRERGVLVGTTGRESNVLKIRPPLVITRDEAEVLVDSLDQVLAEIRPPA